jgi:hypothetical protein
MLLDDGFFAILISHDHISIIVFSQTRLYHNETFSVMARAIFIVAFETEPLFLPLSLFLCH